MDIEHFFSTGLYAKEARFKAGHKDCKHAHSYDHLSILAAGTVVVTIDGYKYQYTGPCCMEVKAGKQHEVEALTDAVWYCIHATSCTDATVIDEVLIAQD